MEEGFDVGLEMSGNAAALRDMIANMAHGGKIALLGIPPEEFAIDWNQVVFNMLTIKGIYGREMYETWYEMTVMLQSGLDISPVITHHFARRRSRGGVRHRRRRRGGQGHPELEGLGHVLAYVTSWPAELDEIRAAGLFKAERVISSPQQANVTRRRRRGAQPLREQLPRARRPSGADRGRAGGAGPLGLRHGVGALHLRHAGDPQGARGEALRASSAPRTRSSTAPASTPTAGCSRRCSGPEDAVISDALNHASIIDGIRLCKAQRFRYANTDMDELEAQLKAAAGARRRLIATDGVFSMDGYVAKLDEICDLAERYDAMVMVDDSHAVGFVGEQRPRHARAQRRDGPRRHHHRHARQGARRRVAAATPAARPEIVDLLRQRSRPYLFSNTLAPPIVAASLKVLELLESGGELRDRLRANTARFRAPHDRARLRRPARRPPDRAGHVRRRGARRAARPKRCSSAAST